MLQSQFAANAQHPDKYAGLDFESRKAHAIEVDVSTMTTDDLRQVLRVPFDMPEHAAKFEDLVAEKMTGTPKGETLTPQKAMLKKKREDMLNYIGDGQVPFKELVANFTGSKSGILKHLQKLVAEGMLVQVPGPRKSVMYRRPPATP